MIIPIFTSLIKVTKSVSLRHKQFLSSMTSVMIWLEWICNKYMACTGMLLVNPLSICCSMNLAKEQHTEIFALCIMCYLRCGQYNMHQNLNHLMRFCHSIVDTSIKFYCENIYYKKQKTFHFTSGY